MNFDQVRALLTEHFKGRLLRAKAEMATAGRLGPIDRHAYSNSADFAEEALSENWPLMPGQADDEWMGRLIELYGLQVKPGTDSYERLRTEAMRAHRDFCKAMVEHDRSLEHYDYSDAVSANIATEHSSGVKAASITLAELARRFVSESNRGSQWASKTQMDKTKHIDLLCEVLGKNTDILRISASDAQTVKGALSRYPKNRQKNPRTRNLPLSEVLEMHDVDKLDIRTLNKYIQTYSSMFEWARRNSYVLENQFGGLAVRRGKNKSKHSRSAFNDQQMSAILDELVYNRNNLVRLEYQKWGPLIALYTGARLNEIAQIHLDDIREHEGIWCFDLNDNDESKKLKTEASRRLVPIHSQLIALGIVQYVRSLRDAGDAKLFPRFEYCQKNGWGRSLGRWFNDQFLVKLGIKTKGLSFHSFRHTVVSALLQADVDLKVVQTLVGHERQGVTHQHYFGSGYKITQLRDGLEKLCFDCSENSK